MKTIIKIKKKTGSIILIIANLFLTLFIIFGTQLTIFANSENGFFIAVANTALLNTDKKVIFSYSKEKSNKTFIENYFSYRDEAIIPKKYDSVLISPAENNKIIFGGEQKGTTAILQNKTYASEQTDGSYKMNSANIFYYGKPFQGESGSVGTAIKNISVSKSIADKMLDTFRFESYEELAGSVIDFQYKNEDEEIITEKMFIRGVLIGGKGDIGKYENLYGEDIVLFYPEYFNFCEIQAHFYFSYSAKNNQDNYKVIIGLGLGNNISIREANSGTNINEPLQKTYDKLINTKTNMFSKIFFTIIYVLVFSVILVLTAIIISNFKNSVFVFFITASAMLIINEMFTHILSLNKYNSAWQNFNSAARGFSVLLYTLSLFVVMLVVKLNRGKSEKAS